MSTQALFAQFSKLYLRYKIYERALYSNLGYIFHQKHLATITNTNILHQFHIKMILQVHFNWDFTRKDPFSTALFDPTTFWLVSSSQDINPKVCTSRRLSLQQPRTAVGYNLYDLAVWMVHCQELPRGQGLIRRLSWGSWHCFKVTTEPRVVGRAHQRSYKCSRFFNFESEWRNLLKPFFKVIENFQNRNLIFLTSSKKRVQKFFFFRPSWNSGKISFS